MLEDFLRLLNLFSRVADLVELGWGLQMCISNNFMGYLLMLLSMYHA